MVKDNFPCGIGPRTAVFLRGRYPRDRAKLIAGQFRVSVSTAQRWLDGTAPTTGQLEAMFALWGADFLRVVFAEAFVLHDSSAAVDAHIQGGINLLQQRGNPADLLRHTHDGLRPEHSGPHRTAWRQLYPVPRGRCHCRSDPHAGHHLRQQIQPRYDGKLHPLRAPLGTARTPPRAMEELDAWLEDFGQKLEAARAAQAGARVTAAAGRDQRGRGV
jgi:hypothetical protein